MFVQLYIVHSLVLDRNQPSHDAGRPVDKCRESQLQCTDDWL